MGGGGGGGVLFIVIIIFNVTFLPDITNVFIRPMFTRLFTVTMTNLFS